MQLACIVLYPNMDHLPYTRTYNTPNRLSFLKKRTIQVGSGPVRWRRTASFRGPEHNSIHDERDSVAVGRDGGRACFHTGKRNTARLRPGLFGPFHRRAYESEVERRGGLSDCLAQPGMRMTVGRVLEKTPHTTFFLYPRPHM